jgi:hypothetical protein
MAYRLDNQTVQADAWAMFDPHFVEQREDVLGLVRALQRAVSPSDFFDLQLELLGRYGGRQAAMEERRARVRAERVTLRQLTRTSPRPVDEIRAVQKRIATSDSLERRDDIFSFLLRILADGIAWRLLRGDRAVFAVLGDGQRVDRLALGKGFDAELARMSELWETHGLLPLHNDLTTGLRYGDLTVLHGDWPDADVAIEEVKASGRKKSRQTQQLEAKLRVLATNYGASAPEGRRFAIRTLPLPYRTYLADLAAVLARARAEGYAYAQPHPALVIAAVEYEQVVGRADELGKWTFRRPRELGWVPEDEHHFSRMAVETRMRDRHQSSAYFAPVSIYPLPAEDLADLLLSRLDYAVTLRVDALRPNFAARNIDVEFATAGRSEKEFLVAKRGPIEVIVPAHIREQMLRELMSPDTLVDLVEFALNELTVTPDLESQRMLFCDERAAWPSAPVYLA